MNQELSDWLTALHKGAALRVANGWQPTPTNAREALAAITDGFGPVEQPLPFEQDWLIQGERSVSVRLYRTSEQPKPVIIFAHGGGHVAGSVSVYNNICRKIARTSDAIVISVDYRLAPECPYPAGIDDITTVLSGYQQPLNARQWAHDGRVFLMGDSGGGAAVSSAAILNAQSGQPKKLDGLVLIYPSVDYRLVHGSIDENADGFMLTKARIEWYFGQYFSLTDDRKAASPLVMLQGVSIPNTLVVTAQYCPLRDEGIAFAELINDQGGNAQLLQLDDTIHAFLNLESMCAEACDQTYKAVAQFILN